MSDDGCAKALAIIPAALFVSFVGLLFDGFVFVLFWRWFVLPVFGGPKLTLLPAVGLGLTLSWLVNDKTGVAKQEMEPDEWWILSLQKAGRTLVFLVFAFVFMLLIRATS